ncbi:unnamed protein product [Linum tenue]|uniref:Protein kinase domain-containing protein n=1 Tax=Linum tenue TaxID=586396 RepID=A0AAV0IIL2_9ROSI|nr:unnamed protein product [Linum tenue]
MSTWQNRLRIAAEIAQALDYLHSLANPPIIHGDIKSTNILLDEGFRAKVADFGASVLIYPDQATAMVNKIQGTLGYLDPDDVYSFGVVMVELLTGEKPYAGNLARTGETVNLIQYFLTSTENMNLGRIINFAVVREAEMDEIEAFAEVARRCLSFSGRKRPTMNEVAEELGRLRKLNECSCGGESCMSPLTGISEGRVGTTEEQPPASIGTLDMESYEIGR